MGQTNQEITQLIGSRICHDLVSPIGAIGNGLELMQLDGTPVTPEITLIMDSLHNANARIRFFRFAFGLATEGQAVGHSDILKTLAAIEIGGRFTYRWDRPKDLSRIETRQVFLALMCLETCLVRGGEISLTCGDGRWHLSGTGPRIVWDAALWDPLCRGQSPEATPNNVQFALLPEALRASQRSLTAECRETAVSLWF